MLSLYGSHLVRHLKICNNIGYNTTKTLRIICTVSWGQDHNRDGDSLVEANSCQIKGRSFCRCRRSDSVVICWDFSFCSWAAVFLPVFFWLASCDSADIIWRSCTSAFCARFRFPAMWVNGAFALLRVFSRPLSLLLHCFFLVFFFSVFRPA